MAARARRPRKSQRTDRAEEQGLLELLSHGLSAEEIQRVLACALLALDERGRDRLLAQLGEETGGTLRGLLASRGGSRTKAQPSPGSAKILEEWEKAWGEWEACVAESGDEDGRYIVRDHHKILERVMDEGLDSDFNFLTAIEDLDAEIGSGLRLEPRGGRRSARKARPHQP